MLVPVVIDFEIGFFPGKFDRDQLGKLRLRLTNGDLLRLVNFVEGLAEVVGLGFLDGGAQDEVVGNEGGVIISASVAGRIRRNGGECLAFSQSVHVNRPRRLTGLPLSRWTERVEIVDPSATGQFVQKIYRPPSPLAGLTPVNPRSRDPHR